MEQTNRKRAKKRPYNKRDTEFWDKVTPAESGVAPALPAPSRFRDQSVLAVYEEEIDGTMKR